MTTLWYCLACEDNPCPSVVVDDVFFLQPQLGWSHVIPGKKFESRSFHILFSYLPIEHIACCSVVYPLVSNLLYALYFLHVWLPIIFPAFFFKHSQHSNKSYVNVKVSFYEGLSLYVFHPGLLFQNVRISSCDKVCFYFFFKWFLWVFDPR